MPRQKAQAFVEAAFKASENCLECRECVERCPYHLEIPALLKKQRGLWDVFLKTGSWAYITGSAASLPRDMPSLIPIPQEC
jgi:Fe-S oxidoreductase